MRCAGTEREAQAMAKKKRGNGEGTIYRRKNGCWSAQYEVYTPKYTPKGPKRRILYGKTRAEVAAKLARGRVEARDLRAIKGRRG